jgi:hypothetical protein
MSLLDTDKSSVDRGTPHPNQHDVIAADSVKAHKTISTHYDAGADTNPGFLQMQNKQIIGNDGTTPTTLYGYNQALNKWGLFVTKAGVDVTTNTDLSKFIFNSGQDVFKIVGTYPISVSVNTASGYYASTTLAHGLGFTPAFVAFTVVPATISGNNPNLNHGNPAMIYGLVGGVFRVLALAEVTADSTNLYFSAQLDGATSAGTYTFSTKVYALQETFS